MSAKRIFPPLCMALFSCNDPRCSASIWSLLRSRLSALGQGNALRKRQKAGGSGASSFFSLISWCQGWSRLKMGEMWVNKSPWPPERGMSPQCKRSSQHFRSLKSLFGFSAICWEVKDGAGNRAALGLQLLCGWLIWQLDTTLYWGSGIRFPKLLMQLPEDYQKLKLWYFQLLRTGIGNLIDMQIHYP